MSFAAARRPDTLAGRGTPTFASSSTNGDFASLAARHLLWLPELGLGYLDVQPAPDFYGADYFDRYQALDLTDTGRALTKARIGFVRRHWQGAIVDVGIGGGYFVTAFLEYATASGWDVNPAGVRWLFERSLFCDPRSMRVDAVTMWDSIEHMANPSEILDNVDRWVFISTPIYRDGDDARGSKHYKPGEHLWYFTESGLVGFMHRHGFAAIEANNAETTIGRESIGSFAFRRSAT
jgi:hypothetical protein